MQSEWLATVAEISAALAGFAALAGLLGRERFDRLAIFGVVETSLIALLFALAPHVLGGLRSAAFGLLVVYTAAWLNGAKEAIQLRRAGFEGGNPLVAFVAFGIALLGSGLAALVALGFLPEHSLRLYEAAVFCPLANACALLWLALRRFLFPENAPPAV